ncbi:hypothetical protein FQN54_001137 [Arachnomyces sp. PD_36]|nr:hypothetical protein FQN54_001137 [Arachnomyces sp. PD_36]
MFQCLAVMETIPFNIVSRGVPKAFSSHIPPQARRNVLSRHGAYIYRPTNSISAKRAASTHDVQPSRERVVVLGSGWGGYTLSRRLSPSKFDCTVISPRSYFVFTPLLTETAAGSLDPNHVVEPVRDGKHKLDFLQAAARSVDFNRKVVVCEASVVRSGVTQTSRIEENEEKYDEGPEGQIEEKEHVQKWEQGQMMEVPYDKLIISVGCVSRTFKTPGVRENAMFFKDVGDAKRVKRRVLECFELASMPHTTPEMKKWLLHFAIIGGGPTGTELSAALSDLIHGDMPRLYPDLKDIVRISLYDVAPKVLSMFDESLSRYATEKMGREGVDIKTEHHITQLRWGPPNDKSDKHEMDPKGCLTLNTKEEGEVGVGMCVWATGNEMNKFVRNSMGSIDGFPTSSAVMKNSTAADPTKNKGSSWSVSKAPQSGALLVDNHLRVQIESSDGQRATMRDVFAVGDNCVIESGTPPATAQATYQEAQWLSARLNKGDIEHSAGFSFRNLGVVAYIGNSRALMQIPHEQVDGGIRNPYLPEGVTGRAAWLIWKAAYLSMSVSWKNRLRILLVWIINPIFGRDISRY